MTQKEFATYIRYGTRTDSTTFPDAEILSIANPIKDYLAGEIEGVNEDYFGMPQTTDLLKTDTTREYPFPPEFLNRLKRIEANLLPDDTYDDNWVTLNEVDMNFHKHTSDEATIQASFGWDEDSAFYEIFRGSIWLLTGEIEDDVTAGLKLWSFDYPADIDDLSDDTDDMSVDPSTTTLGFPKAFHQLWADAVVIEYKSNRDKPIPLTKREERWEFYLGRALDSIKNTNRDHAVVTGVPSEEANDEGYEY